MGKVVLFGDGEMAKIAYYYLKYDSEHEVVSFCVNRELKPEENEHLGLPINSFEVVVRKYPSNKYQFFAPLSSEKMNTEREIVYKMIKNKGYKMISYISKDSIIYTNDIGENCFIQAGNIIHPFTKIGNNVVLWSGNLVGHHGVIKDHVTFASHVAMAGNCVIGENCYLGTNSTIRDNIILAKGTLVGMATAITRNTEAWSVYLGNPARKIGNGISKSILKI